MRHAALYTRVSSAGQVDNYSLDHQESQLRDYCSRNSIEVAAVYQDAGISGSTIADRPAIQRLIQDAQDGLFNEVLIYKVDRFTRADPWDLYPLIKGLMDLNIQISSATESFNLNDEDGQLIFSILANFAARERRMIIQRTSSGKRSMAKEGRFTGGRCPFGYAVGLETGQYIPDETIWWGDHTKAQVVQLIFEQFLKLGGAGAVATWLLRHGVPAPKSNWNPASVHQIVRNPVYKGDFAWGKRSHQLHKKSKINRPHEWIVCKNSHPALISEETWDQCQLERSQRHKGGRPPESPRRLLDGLMVCPQCGSTLTPRAKSNGVFYTCASRFNRARLRDGTACVNAPSWDGEQLAEHVWRYIVGLVLTGEVLKLAQTRQSDRETSLREAADKLAKAKRQMQEVEQKEERLLDQFLNGRFSEQVLNKKQDQLEIEKTTARTNLRAAETEWGAVQEAAPSTNDLSAMQRHLRDVLDNNAPVEERRRLLELWLGGRIVAQEDGQIQIPLRIPTDGTSNMKSDKPSVPLRPEP